MPKDNKSNAKNNSLSNNNQICESLSTIRDFMRYGLTQFNQHNIYCGHGTDNNNDEIINLIRYTLHLEHHQYQPHILDAKLLPDEKQNIIQLIQKRVNSKIPLAYLINQTQFCGLDLYVDQRVIIPRSPIASLIEQQFQPWINNPDNTHDILDLCTGSGCIAIALAYAFEQAQIDAIELSDDAIEVAKINIKKHELEARVNLIKSNLFNKIKNKKYDLIISNPPYVNQHDLDNMPKEFCHEPKMALAAGKDGLDLVRIILKEAQNHLNKDGLLIIEVGNSQADLEKLYPKVPFTWLDFEDGAYGVFVLTYQQLIDHKSYF